MSVNEHKEIGKSLKKYIEEFLKNEFAIKVDFVNKKALTKPSKTEITYILPQAKSANIYVLLFDREKIRDYLAKEDGTFHEYETNRFYLN